MLDSQLGSNSVNGTVHHSARCLAKSSSAIPLNLKVWTDKVKIPPLEELEKMDQATCDGVVTKALKPVPTYSVVSSGSVV